MFSRLGKTCLLLLLAAGTFAIGQSNSDPSQQEGKLVEAVPKAAPDPSPAAAYQEAMRPVEITHRSVGNWSDIEQASLAIAVKQAKVACAARSAEDHTGEALIDLGRLCILGLGWDAVIQATGRYLHEKDSPKPHAADAYAAKINAELELKDKPAAIKDANEMLETVPYNSVVADATNELINYLELLYTSDAVVIAAKRQVFILEQLRVSSPTDPAAIGPAATAETPTTHDLYRQGLVLARLQQLDGHPDASAETIAALDKALPLTLPGDDLAAIQAMRGQYAQLGLPLSEIPLTSPGVPVRYMPVPPHGPVTVLLLFPDWCAQGIRLARQIPEAPFSVEGHEANMFSLLVETVPPKALPHGSDDKTSKGLSGFDPAYAAEYLKETRVATVTPALLERFHATDVPLLIVADSQGVVRLIDVADDTILQPGKAVDSAVALIGKRWPATIGSSTSAKTANSSH